MISGGADSSVLLTGLASELGGGKLVALHVNYGLRPTADEDEALVRRLCEELGVELEVERASAPEGNVQAWARELRHRRARSIKEQRDLDWIAVGHTRSDQVETVLYRLAASPGSRPLIAMPPSSGPVIRPLLELSRRQVRRIAEVLLPEWAEDESNTDLAFARSRVRHEVIPALERINPGAERNVARTRRELEEDEDALVAQAEAALADAEADRGPGVAAGPFLGQHPAIARRMLRLLAESDLRRPVAVSPELAVLALRLARDTEGGRIDLGGGDQLVVESARLRIEPADADLRPPDPVPLVTTEGETRFGDWEIISAHTTEREARSAFGNPWSAFLDLEGLAAWPAPGGAGAPLVRAWRSGDRIEPLGMSGSKALQDVFTDSLVPSSRRRAWPVLALGGEVIWVPGLSRSRHLLIGGPDKPVLRLQARPPFPI